MPNIKRANTSGITKSGVAIPDVPDAPIIGAVTDLGTGTSASVAYTAAATGGTVTTFTATSTPGSITGTGSSPITVSGLTTGVSYTFKVKGTNATATGPESSASSSLTIAPPPAAFYSLATTLITSPTQTYTFSNIDQDFKHLVIRVSGRCSGNGAADFWLTLNGNTSSNYRHNNLIANSSGITTGVSYATSRAAQFNNFLSPTGNSGGQGTSVVNYLISNYSSSSINKSITAFGGLADGVATNGGMTQGLYYANTNAITSITFNAESTSYQMGAGTRLSLYGLKG